ncbi:uncharacterized protein B0I36DRAFT_328511 [Microdochium trichocladiopsis]|uniref:C3H1-type domain-containing protein n=1 Tax=Microdochium trichocladiopsis TaxID=1682393 RepID=A0A9P8Y4Z8_9PEZI|nr:uncharacterized protein B0I36DRAFT_328511 [Microdochium trichocladiopsis]KAH7028047.1 hypothetical protein B0I36DRAFT_328511 [Microdochium trichocladiopsis]
MLSDQAIDDATAALEAFRRSDALAKLLDDYSSLLDDYKRLKSDYEEEREGRERYKQLARSQERNPFALVLVDGDGYIFDEDLVRAGEEGGSRAAVRLNDAVKNSLRRRGIDNCEIIIRVYADLVGLSKFLSRNGGQCGAEKRSLSSFVAGFNRSHGLTDFVDAGELKENADFKLKAMLRLYADNTQCKHIFFAACHDIGYIADVTPFRGHVDRFTLVRTPSLRFCDEFKKLGMGIEELPGVFRTTPIHINHPGTALTNRSGVTPPSAKSSASMPVRPSSPTKSLQSSSAGEENQKVCQFNKIGKCKFGNGCKLKHVKPSASSTAPGPGRLQKNDFSSASTELHYLPRKNDIPPGYVAINRDGCRLDPLLETPPPGAMAKLRARPEDQKLCNMKQLTGYCGNNNCPYDHDPISDDLLMALETLSRSLPCPRRGTCRVANCVNGHVCQNPDCKHRGGKSFCRLPYLVHDEDLHFDSLMPGITKDTDYGGGSHDRLDSIDDKSSWRRTDSTDNTFDLLG